MKKLEGQEITLISLTNALLKLLSILGNTTTVFGTKVHTSYGESLGIVLMGAYLLIVNILLLNLLIAVFK